VVWSQITDAVAYHLQVDDNSNFGSPIIDLDTLTTLSYTFTTPLNPGRYYWRVRCTDGSIWSYFSQPWDFIISILETPVTISPVNGGLVYSSQPTFVWHVAPGAIRYHFQLDDAANFATPVVNNPNVPDTSYQIPTPISAGTFYWRVRAYDGLLWSAYSSTWNFFTAVPNAPTLVSPADSANVFTDPPTFIWQASTGATSYDIAVDDNNDFSSPVFTVDGFQGTTITPPDPFGPNTYYWHVRAEGDFGYSPFSTTFLFVITGEPGYPFLPGDANMHVGLWPPQAIGADITYIVNYLRNNPINVPCYLDGVWLSADINGSCAVDGSDVIRFVNYLRGTIGLTWCPGFDPQWPTPQDLPPNQPPGWPNCDNVAAASKTIPVNSGE